MATSNTIGAKKEYLSKFEPMTWRKILKFQRENPVDDKDGKKMSINRVINLAVEAYIK